MHSFSCAWRKHRNWTAVFIHWLIYSFIHSFICTLIQSFIHLLIHSCIHSLFHSTTWSVLLKRFTRANERISVHAYLPDEVRCSNFLKNLARRKKRYVSDIRRICRILKSQDLQLLLQTFSLSRQLVIFSLKYLCFYCNISTVDVTGRKLQTWNIKKFNKA
jgi:hypothetical protein